MSTTGHTDSTVAPITCAVDDSSGAREAVIASAALAERLDAPLICVHVVPPGVRAVETGEQLLGAVAGSGGRDGGATHRVEIGPTADRVAAVAFAEGADLIVVGSRGRGAVAAALLGSVSRELIGLAPCPVLVVPPGAAVPARAGSRGRKRSSIVCGVDGSGEADYAAEAASSLAWRMNNRLVLTHFDSVTELVRVAWRERAELIAVGANGQGKLAASSPVPVVVVPPATRIDPGERDRDTTWSAA